MVKEQCGRVTVRRGAWPTSGSVGQIGFVQS